MSVCSFYLGLVQTNQVLSIQCQNHTSCSHFEMTMPHFEMMMSVHMSWVLPTFRDDDACCAYELGVATFRDDDGCAYELGVTIIPCPTFSCSCTCTSRGCDFSRASTSSNIGYKVSSRAYAMRFHISSTPTNSLS